VNLAKVASLANLVNLVKVAKLVNLANPVNPTRALASRIALTLDSTRERLQPGSQRRVTAPEQVHYSMILQARIYPMLSCKFSPATIATRVPSACNDW
jgi:hypothetical protein